VVETESIGSLAVLRGEAEMALAVRFRGTEHSVAILGTVRHNHFLNWVAIRVKDNSFDSLSKLGLFNNYELSNCFRRSHEERERKGDCYRPTYKTIAYAFARVLHAPKFTLNQNL